MLEPTKQYYEKRAKILVQNLKSRQFEAVYCESREEALKQALAWIPKGATIGFGGATSAQQIGLLDAIHSEAYHCIDRDLAPDRVQAMRQCLLSDVFITGANALSLSGEMVNIDGMGNRVAAICYGPSSVIVIAGMNKVTHSLEDAVRRARTVAAPMNKQRFPADTPCLVTGSCGDCKVPGCICNQIVITRNCRPAGRIKVILVGEELGF
jgi:hypothetical protein